MSAWTACGRRPSARERRKRCFGSVLARIDPVTIGGGETSLFHPNAADYRPISAADGPVTIDLLHEWVHQRPKLCPRHAINAGAGAESVVAKHHRPATRSRAILSHLREPGDRRVYGLSLPCAAIDLRRPLDLCGGHARESNPGSAPPRSGGPSWYIMISTAGPVTAQRSDGGTGNLALCTDCSLTNCQPLSSFSATADRLPMALFSNSRRTRPGRRAGWIRRRWSSTSPSARA